MRTGGILIAWIAPLVFAAGLAQTAESATTFSVPALTGPVVDRAGLISAGAQDQLSDYLSRLYDSGGTQIEVVTLPDLGGVSIEEAGIKIAEAWKLGRQGQDTGIILLIAALEHKIRIEVGKGREGDLPDLTASRIIREQISPALRAGNYDEAVTRGVLAITQKTDPDFQPPRRRHEGRRGGGDGRGLLALFILFFFILPLFFRGGGGGGGGFLAGAVLGNLLGQGGRRDGGGGGGWSGGGGGFSGGGASGDW